MTTLGSLGAQPGALELGPLSYGDDALILVFQVAFTSDPGDSEFTWVTVPGTMDVDYSRGAPNEFGRSETGESVVRLGDAASQLDPNNPDSIYAPNVRRMKPMRAFMVVDGVEWPLFQHFIERLPRLRSVGEVWTERALQGVDAFAWWALAGLKGRTYSGEATGTRWGNVLDDLGWPAGRRDIDAGNSSLDPVTFAADDSTKGLEHLLAVVENENGFGFINAEGEARFQERHDAILNTTIAATFADGRSADTGYYPGALPYVDLQPESTDIVNDYTGKREGGAVQAASDAASIEAYGPRSAELTFLVDSDAEVQSALEWRLSQTKDPHERVDAIVVRPGDNAATWAAVLALEVGSRILVVEWPPGYTAPVETEFFIRHLAASIPASYHASEFTFQLTPAAQDTWMVLDDSVAGVLDSNKLAY
jgi:hypothetical protein